MTKVVNLYKEPYDVYIGRKWKGRDGYFGNPYRSDVFGHDECIERYKTHFYCRIENDLSFKTRILELKGKTLGCFCKPKSCHGDVIADYLNKL